jgi:hypothetical protein
MADSSSLAPTGYQVASTNVAGATGGNLLDRFLNLAAVGVRGYVDLETAKLAGSGADTSDVIVATGQNQPQTGTAAAAAAAATNTKVWAGVAIAVVLVAGYLMTK